MDHRKGLVHFFGQILDCLINIILELVGFNLGYLSFLLEEHKVGSDFFNLYLELLHQLFVGLALTVDLDKFLLFDVFRKGLLLFLKILHHLVAHNALTSNLDYLLLKNLYIFSDLPKCGDISFR
jgi:hypothetical protein